MTASHAARPAVKCYGFLTLPLNSVILQVLTDGNTSLLVSSYKATISAQILPVSAASQHNTFLR